jgi:putative protein-disulfide isomerase
MPQTRLHYIYDPLCGWCYGAAPLIQAASQLSGVAIELHAGGLWLGSRRQAMGTALRDYVRPHDERIEALTGQHFGERYFNELLLNPAYSLDSEPPIRAILAITKLGGSGLQLLTRIQHSHYRDGHWIGHLPRLTALAEEQGVNGADFVTHYGQADLAGHLAESQQWLRRLGGQGYPTLGLERQGELIPIPVAPFLGEPAAFVRQLQSLLATGEHS